MIEIYRTENIKDVKKVLCHPVIYDLISDDGSPERESFEPPIHDLIYYIALEIKRELAGIYQLCALNSICYEGHINILPKFWGNTHEFTVAGLEWVRQNTPIRKIQGHIPENCAHVLNHALKAGFRIEGRREKSILKGGKLLDQHIVGYQV